MVMGIKLKKPSSAGFTIVEVLVVIVVIGLIAAISYTNYGGTQEKTYYTRAQTDLSTIANALKLYVLQNDVYPPDTNDGGVPSAINKYIATENYNNEWPNGPWPNSLIDYDAWDIDGDSKTETYQISIRFCTFPEANGPNGAQLCKTRAPKQPWATNFNSNNNSIYYCVKGYCRPNSPVRYDYPGYCINCPNNLGYPKPDGS
jgi:type II secretion system protein G